MKNSSTVFKAGTRCSELALLQTRQALDNCERRLPNVRFETVTVDTPGDRDRRSDLRNSPADFFCKDLDDALLTGKIDCALHSAKDLPEQKRPPGIDRFWLPWAEEPRDAIVLSKNATKLPSGRIRIGVSSERRENYGRRRFPEAELASIRGNVGDRLAQVDNGEYDMLIMAAAALHRLNLETRIFECIPLADLRVPEGQGVLALTFRRGDSRFLALRNLLIPPVILAGAGIGGAENTTLGVVETLRHCDVCLHDSLLPAELLRELPGHAVKITVGKRCGSHSASQSEICRMLIDFAQKGRRVLRLKGGDPTVFGRLAEEVDALQAESLPFRVLPGVGAMSVAAASTGILPSRRETARGFSVMTPRKADSGEFEPLLPDERLRIPQILYMASKVIPQLARQYLGEGFAPATPVALVYNAGNGDEQSITGTLETIAERWRDTRAKNGPALVFIGDIAAPERRFRPNAPLDGKRILYCGSQIGVRKAKQTTQRHGGKFAALPLIETSRTGAADSILNALRDFEWLVVTSPSCADLFLSACAEADIDLRHIPELAVCGPGTGARFREKGLLPAVEPGDEYGAPALITALSATNLQGKHVLRLRSDKAGETVARQLRDRGAEVADTLFYRNTPVRHDTKPEAHALIFTSTSTVRAFVDNFGRAALNDTLLCAIGEPTYNVLTGELQLKNVLKSVETTVPGCIDTVAGHFTAQKMCSTVEEQEGRQA